MFKFLDDRDSLFLFLWGASGLLAFEILGLYYILLCYLTDNVWWGNSFEWFGTILNLVP